MSFNFTPITRVSNITKSEFIARFYKPQIPVVIEKLTEDWPASKQWTFDYIKSVAGHLIVPLYNSEPVKAEDGFNEPKARMKLSEYIDLLERESTDLRIFLFNLIKEAPQLQEDFHYPKLGLTMMKTMPMMFFGGYDSKVFMHYDIDLANIFHFHFAGTKQCILVHPSQSKFMYQVPFSVISREDIDFENPDFEKFPLLKNLKPYKAILNHGDTLYMPEGYWHYMKYVTPGFSMSLRSIPKKPKHLTEALYNVFIMRYIDAAMRKIQGQKWIDYKNNKAIKHL
ncbi:MAG: cupin-like domain-containing protein [Weeksellaceae bacterium]